MPVFFAPNENKQKENRRKEQTALSKHIDGRLAERVPIVDFFCFIMLADEHGVGNATFSPAKDFYENDIAPDILKERFGN